MTEEPVTNWPHMCQDGHEAIGFSGDRETCPMCQARDSLSDALGMATSVALGIEHSPMCRPETLCCRCRMERAHNEVARVKEELVHLRDYMFCEVEPEGETHSLDPGMVCVVCYSAVGWRNKELRESLQAIREASTVLDRSLEGWLPGVGRVVNITVTTEEMAAFRTALKAHKDP